ncbi:hypothetical protein [Pandoraea sputorum]|uniref:Uncharacterized protein n=1 Tax=Pandoraea sputorum TaxID=93222 RepID=A0A5E5BL14_9BURK|nr:hypothetical protein [Pandoraea sputorum]VVE85812.1 hypothetical protein PSP31121_05443 [Pandoraea sputorum]
MKQTITVSKTLRRMIFHVELLVSIATPIVFFVECWVFSLTQLKSVVSTAIISMLTTLVINCVLSIMLPRWMYWFASASDEGRQVSGNAKTYHNVEDVEKNRGAQ